MQLTSGLQSHSIKNENEHEMKSISSISAFFFFCQEAKAKKMISKKDRKEKKMLSSKDDKHFLLSGVKLAAHRG